MNIAKAVSDVGPVILNQLIAQGKTRGEDTSMLEDYGPHVLNALTDAFLATEHYQERQSKARFCANLAAELLGGWAGEPTKETASEAVQLAKHLIEESEKAFAAP